MKIDVEINLIQAVVLKRDIEHVKLITTLALEEGGPAGLDAILKEEMEYSMSDSNWSDDRKDWNISPKCSWISDATVIHLATCWHVESLIHFLDVSPLLCHLVTSQSKCDCEDVLQFEKCKEIFGDLIEDRTKCKEDLELILQITRFVSWSFLGILTAVEILQFFIKVVNAILAKSVSEFWEYFSKQNMCEVLMLVLGQTFFANQYKDLQHHSYT